MSAKTVTVFGGTGTSGGGAVRQFLEAGWNVRAVTRDKTSDKAKATLSLGADLAEADLANRDSIRAAISGSDVVYFSGASLGNRYDIGQAVEGINVADAAAEEGIGHFIFQSALSQYTGKGVLSLGSKRAIEERIAELGLPATISRPSYFMDNFLTYFPVNKEGDTLSIAMALPGDKVQGMVSAEDIGKAAVAMASDPDKYIGAEIDLIADSVSFNGMAETISAAAGKPCAAITVPFEAIEEHWPQGLALYKWLSTDTAEYDTGALADLIGSPLSFSQWVEKYLLPTL